MKLLLIIAAAVMVGLLPDLPRKRRRRDSKPPPVNCAPLVLHQIETDEKRRKAEAKRRETLAAVQYEAANVALLDAMLDTAKAAYTNAAGEKEREKQARKIIALRRQIQAAEARIERAKNKAGDTAT